jgi:hypothetical protein
MKAWKSAPGLTKSRVAVQYRPTVQNWFSIRDRMARKPPRGFSGNQR